VSLEGSLETIALPDVLHLLTATSKSGELRVHGGPAVGRLWFVAGQLSAFDVGRGDQAIDALFDLLRIETGTFLFDADAVTPPNARRPATPGDPESAGPTELQPLLDEAQSRLVEWREIVAVVPSLAHQVHLVPLVSQEVLLEAEHWALVVTIGDGRPVSDVLDRLHLPEFEGCRALKQLAEAALITFLEPVEAAVVRVEVYGALPSTELGISFGDAEYHPTADTGGFLAGGSPAGGSGHAPWTPNEVASLDQMRGWRDEMSAPATVTEEPAEAVVHDEPAVAVVPDEPVTSLEPANGEEPAEPAALAAVDGTGADTEYQPTHMAGGPVQEEAEVDGELDPDPDAVEPINRGMLLKFLSSVRS
jgi:hypothetical protein